MKKNKVIKIVLFLSFFLISCDKNSEKNVQQQNKNIKEITTKPENKYVSNNNENNNSKSIDDLKRDIQKNSNFTNNFEEQGDYNNQFITSNPLDTLNNIRNKIGLNALYIDKSLMYASEKHADYVIDNDIAAHNEDSSKNDYYAQWPIDRALKAGYSSLSGSLNVGEVLTLSQESPNNSLDSLLRAIYHRFIMLEPAYNDVGFYQKVSNDKSTLSMLLGVKDISNQLPKLQLSYFPYNNSVVPTTFIPSEEIPNPVPEKDKVGYPISVQLPLGYKLDISYFSLLESNTGKNIEGKILNSTNDQHVEDNQFAFIPWEPLTENTKYTVYVKGKTQGATINFSWSFNTLSQSKFSVKTDKTNYSPGDILNINYSMTDARTIQTNLEMTGASKILLEKIPSSNFGVISYKVLSGCLLTDGCPVNFNFTNDLNQKAKLNIIIEK